MFRLWLETCCMFWYVLKHGPLETLGFDCSWPFEELSGEIDLHLVLLPGHPWTHGIEDTASHGGWCCISSNRCPLNIPGCCWWFPSCWCHANIYFIHFPIASLWVLDPCKQQSDRGPWQFSRCLCQAGPGKLAIQDMDKKYSFWVLQTFGATGRLIWQQKTTVIFISIN